MNEEEIQKYLEFLIAGGVLRYGELESLSFVKDEMVEAGRRFLALKSALAAAAHHDIGKVWSIFDGGQTQAKNAVQDIARSAASQLQEMLDRESES